MDLIPPFNRMLLEVTFGKLYSWAIQNVRNILLEASARFKELGEWSGDTADSSQKTMWY